MTDMDEIRELLSEYADAVFDRGAASGASNEVYPPNAGETSSRSALLQRVEALREERGAALAAQNRAPSPPETPAPSPVESPGEEGAQIEKETYEGVVREVVSALASGSPMCACRAHLGDRFRNPATCVGAYEDPRNLQFGCEACCSHGNEDGWCVPLRAPAAAESTRADLAEIADRLEAGMVGPAVKVIVVREAVAALRSLRAPREVEEVRGLRPEVLAFARVMSAKIDGHNHDRGEYGWRSAHAARLIQWLDGYVEDLRAALSIPAIVLDETKVLSRAANVANLAMMIADVCGALSSPSGEAPERGPQKWSNACGDGCTGCAKCMPIGRGPSPLGESTDAGLVGAPERGDGERLHRSWVEMLSAVIGEANATGKASATISQGGASYVVTVRPSPRGTGTEAVERVCPACGETPSAARERWAKIAARPDFDPEGAPTPCDHAALRRGTGTEGGK